VSTQAYQNNRAFAKKMDQEDELHSYRSMFHIPIQQNGKPNIYLCGNSLGLQPKTTESYIAEVLKDWKTLAVDGHFHSQNPWVPYHDVLNESMAKVVGAIPIEVAVMNTLTVNLHLMMVSFYRPKGNRKKVLIEADAFPSDKYAVESQIRFHGLDPKDCLVELSPREGEICLHDEDILEQIDQVGDELALVLLGNTNYYTGQFFDMKEIANQAHANGALVGFDCAHGAGNVELNLHDSGCDFAVWCTYKYLNGGPGSIGGAFVHERHAHDRSIPRFEGWWGHKGETRFNMRGAFDPIPGMQGWQLSNQPILSMVAIQPSLQLFDEIGMPMLRKKAISLTGYLEYLVKSLGEDVINIITPSDPLKRGSQLSIQVKNADKELFEKISEAGGIADWREPDVIRITATAMYNSYEDVFDFYEILKRSLV